VVVVEERKRERGIKIKRKCTTANFTTCGFFMAAALSRTHTSDKRAN
jgi:hypothetical protein